MQTCHWPTVPPREVVARYRQSVSLDPGPSRAHVIFPLVQDDDGWPPVGSERVWAVPLGDDRYCIDNAPWFVRDLAVGDIVRAIPEGPRSNPVFRDMLRPSEHVTIRLVCFRDGALEGDLARALEPFTKLGVYGEGVKQYRMLALDIEPTAPMEHVVALLRGGAAEGWWEYEEGRITPAWIAASQG